MLKIKNITKIIHENGSAVRILKGITIQIKDNAITALHGPSGAGKTTLLNIIGTIDTPSSGSITFKGIDIHKLSLKELATFRNKTLGFLFQDENLIKELSVIENIALPLIIAGNSIKKSKQQALAHLKKFKLEKLAKKNVAVISAGERQRVSLLKATIHQPQLLLCDEPTACLDSKNSKIVISFIKELHRKNKTTTIIASHNKELLKAIKNKVEIFDGKIR